MKTLLRIVSFFGLALTVLPPMLALSGRAPSASFTLMNIGMVLWFVTAVFWVKGGQAENE